MIINKSIGLSMDLLAITNLFMMLDDTLFSQHCMVVSIVGQIVEKLFVFKVLAVKRIICEQYKGPVVNL